MDLDLSFDDEALCRRNKKLFAPGVEDYGYTRRRRSSLGSFAISRHDYARASERRVSLKDRLARDRFIANKTESNLPMVVTPRSRRLAKAMADPLDGKLNYSQENIDPVGSGSRGIPYRWQLSQLTRQLYEIASTPSVTSAASNICSHPMMCLGAVGLDDDFYARPAAWSKTDMLAVTLDSNIVLRNMRTQTVSPIKLVSNGEEVSCVKWSPDAAVLASGDDWGFVRAYDPETQQLVAECEECDDEEIVGDISWKDANTLAVAYQSGMMRTFDIRAQKLGKLNRIHKARACGIEWNPDGRFLASGGGDGSVVCWDSRADKALATLRLNSASTSSSTTPHDFECKWRSRKHLSTVKALAWSPWAPDLLASGGGTKDGVIHFWDAVRGAQQPLRISTKAQITSLHFAPGCREVVSTAGYPFALSPSSTSESTGPGRTGTGPRVLPAARRHSVLVHNYPRGELVGKIFDETHGRITHSCLSPDGTRLLTCGSDNSVRIYRVFGSGKQDAGVREDDMHSMSIIR